MEIQKSKCKVCGSENIIFDSSRGEYLCQNCGAVLEDYVIDLSQEWRAFSSEQLERRARTGSPLSIVKHDKGLSTQVGKGTAELYKVPTEKRFQYYRLTQWSKRLSTSKDRNISYALSELQRIVSSLQLPKTVLERAAMYYEQLISRGAIRGRSLEGIIASLVYYAAKELHTPRTFDEIAEVVGIDKRELGRVYRYVARELGLRILPADARDFIPRFCSLINVSEKVQKRALELLEQAEKAGIVSGKGPTGIAAAVIFIASLLEGERRTQREIAEKCKLTEVTIRNRYKEIVERLGLENIIKEKEAELEKEETIEKKIEKKEEKIVIPLIKKKEEKKEEKKIGKKEKKKEKKVKKKKSKKVKK
ncbi:MAG: TFIIB-type zinc ribbon-containing protein [Candidatus Aenigmatarchaeota archaeon]